LYLTGAGVPRDADEARRWLRVSAEAGDRASQVDFANLLIEGTANAEDSAKLAEWFQKAAASGDPVAAFNVGLLFAKGVGADRNEEQAAEWLRRAAEGVPEAQYMYGRMLTEGKFLKEGAVIPLSKTNVFAAQHYLIPAKGAAVFINAFNFPAWGFCEKAAPALLSGVPVMIKPASPTAWLTHRMVEDTVKAGILPAGAISILCGSARDLLDHVRESDIVSFTGSAETAARIRSNPNVVRRSTRVNIEADSINSAILGPDVAPGSDVFDLFVKEVVREMTLKAGQKCTAIRRIFVPAERAAAVADALAARLAKVVVGDPRREDVRMGPVVTRAQQAAALKGISELSREASLVVGGTEAPKLDGIDSGKSSFVAPTLMKVKYAGDARAVHTTEVFGPVATILPYKDEQEAFALVARGGGSLVASVYGDDPAFLARAVKELGAFHGRLLMVDSSIADVHSGHGIVMPQCHHGGPGRAGNGEELGGLNGLRLYHQRVAVQGSAGLLAELQTGAATLN